MPDWITQQEQSLGENLACCDHPSATLSGNIKIEEDAAALSPVSSTRGRKEFSWQGGLGQQGAWHKHALRYVGNPLERVLACYSFPLRYMLAPRIFQVWVWSQPHKMSGKEALQRRPGKPWALVFGFRSRGERWLAHFKQKWPSSQPKQFPPSLQRSVVSR